MKKVLVLLSGLALALALLSGCVSGGGGAAAGNGGGGGGGFQAMPSENLDPPKDADDVFSVGSKVVTVNTDSPNFTIIKNDDGLVLNSNGTNLGRSAEISWRDFRTQGKFLTASNDTLGRYSNTTTNYKATDKITLGGKKLGLSHADFGMWDAHDTPAGHSDTVYTYTPFTMGDGKTASFVSGNGTQTFKGTTVAIAHGGETSDISLVGDAQLEVHLDNFADSSLSLTFPSRIGFVIPVTINTNGVIYETSSGSVNVTGSLTGKNLNGLTADVAGQFYGDRQTDPSEAVGSYKITGGGDDPTTVNGSFGVKK